MPTPQPFAASVIFEPLFASGDSGIALAGIAAKPRTTAAAPKKVFVIKITPNVFSDAPICPYTFAGKERKPAAAHGSARVLRFWPESSNADLLRRYTYVVPILRQIKLKFDGNWLRLVVANLRRPF